MACHVPHSKRQGDDQDDGQAFGYNGDKDGDGDNELLDNDFFQIDVGFAIRNQQIQRNQQNSDDERNESKELA